MPCTPVSANLAAEMKSEIVLEKKKRDVEKKVSILCAEVHLESFLRAVFVTAVFRWLHFSCVHMRFAVKPGKLNTVSSMKQCGKDKREPNFSFHFKQ